MGIALTIRGDDSSEPITATFPKRRITIGRAPDNDLQLPEPSVSLRHASLEPSGETCVVVDHATVNGTFVGGVRLAANSKRLVRSGDILRLGAVFLELRVDDTAPPVDEKLATREIALALVSQWMNKSGAAVSPRLRVVEGPELGATLDLAEEGREYRLGRAETCALVLTDLDASREHAGVVLRGGRVVVQDLGAKNRPALGEEPLQPRAQAEWPPALMLRLGRTVIALELPAENKLTELELIPDVPASLDVPASPADNPSKDDDDQQAHADEGGDVVAESPREPASAPVASVSAARMSAPRAQSRVAERLVVAGLVVVLSVTVLALVWLLVS